MKVYKDPTVMSADYKDFLKNQKTMIPLLKALGNQTETIVEDFEVAKEGRYYQIKEFIPGATNLRDWMEANFDFVQRLDVAILQDIEGCSRKEHRPSGSETRAGDDRGRFVEASRHPTHIDRL